MSRRLYLDEGPGETRGVVTLDARPERLLIRRVTTHPTHHPGARLVARVRRIERPLATAFLDLGAQPDAVTPFTGAPSSLTEGARVEVEVLASPRAGKGAVVRVIGPGEGEPRVLVEAPSLADQLRAFAPGVAIVRGAEARAVADRAEDDVVVVVHSLPSGGSIAIEPTRALVAIDVDVGAASGDARRAAGRANREAIAASARLLRLKGLGGAVVIDLAGKGHDGEALKALAQTVFGPDQPGVVLGAITRFGLWPIILPHRAAPVAEILGSGESGYGDEMMAFRLLREIERAAGASDRIEARAAPGVAKVAIALGRYLTERIGARFLIVPDPAVPRAGPLLSPWEPSA